MHKHLWKQQQFCAVTAQIWRRRQAFAAGNVGCRRLGPDVCEYVHVLIFMLVFLCVHIRRGTDAFAAGNVVIVCVCIHTCMHEYVHTNMHTYIHTYSS